MNAIKPAKVIDWESREIYRVSAIDANAMVSAYDVTKRSTDTHGRTVWEAFNFGVSKPFLTITFTD